jgi:hypothetical protein
VAATRPARPEEAASGVFEGNIIDDSNSCTITEYSGIIRNNIISRNLLSINRSEGMIINWLAISRRGSHYSNDGNYVPPDRVDAESQS